jgi:Domain of unknown function (DUF4129)
VTRTDETARVAGLAAAAEACVVALPAATVLVSTASRVGTAAFAMVWVALNGLAAAGAVRLRSNEGVQIWLVAAAVGSGLLLGRGNVGVSVGISVLMLLAGVRLFTRATRTDPAPSASELWIWTTILGAEVMLASIVPRSTWSTAAIVLTPTELALGFAGRATAVWSADHDPGEPAELRASGARLGRRLALVPFLGSLAAVVAGPGGPVDRLGSLVGFALRWVATLVAFAGIVVFFPIAWGWQLVAGHSDMVGFLSRLRIQQGTELRHPSHAVGTPLAVRALGLAFLACIIWAGLVLVRRVRARPAREGPIRRPEAAVSNRTVPATPREPEPGPFRRRLPRDRIRRRYAELLLLFSRAGVGKEPGLTPGEYLGVVGAAYPACDMDFATVTRAYETVRYAERQPDATAVRSVDAAARRVRRAVRWNRTPPP